MRNIEHVKQENLCIQCGICSAICHLNCISFKDNFPNVNGDCKNCGLCEKACPINQLKEYKSSANLNDYILGNVIDVYNVQTLDKDILANSQSGGAVTSIVKYLLENDVYESAFLVEGYNYDKQLQTKRFIKGDNLNNTSKSRYLTINHFNTAFYIKNHPDEKIIIVGTPCVIVAFNNFINIQKLNRDNYLLLGLICDKTMNYNVNKYFQENPVSKGKILKELFFRTKDAGGWPGNLRLTYTDGTYIDLPRKKRMEVKDYFVLERCLYCPDKLNRRADIVFGDNYIGKPKDRDINGESTIIIRTQLGQDIWEKSAGLFRCLRKTSSELAKGQGIHLREKNIEYARIKGLLDGNSSKKYKSMYKKALKKIKLGNDKYPYMAVSKDIKFENNKKKLMDFLCKIIGKS
ncbi:MAG: Coenzyme F420 hydrogenase/dehydrogenase, beta subunit C-terminal domain [bacterium]|nr:Coenzyme F420 hydrogenase/dehydrogenase, beta subunit C-terminal domain [bacterium]